MKRLSTITVFLLSFFISAHATCEEKTRAEILDKQRDEKSHHLVPEKMNIAQRLLLQFENGAGLNYKSFYPTYGAGSPGAGFMPGVRFWKPHAFGSPFDFQTSASYSTKSYELYQLQFGTILQKGPEPFVGFGGTGGLSTFRGTRKRRSNAFIYADLRYLNFPQEDFYGLGPDSQKADRTDYGLESSSFDGVFGYHFQKYMVVGLRAGFVQDNIFHGTDSRFPNIETKFSPIEAPGLIDQPNFIRVAASTFLDYRDNPGHPHSGGMYGFGYARFDDLDEDRFRFNRYTIDLRQYVSLGSVQRTIAARFLTILNKADQGSRIPFYLLDYLGGTESLRGFPEFRFRDNNLVYMSAEYRWEGTHAMEFAFFFDAGKVFHEIGDFSLDHLETSPGFGIRFKTPSSTMIRIDVAHSNESGLRYLIKFGASF